MSRCDDAQATVARASDQQAVADGQSPTAVRADHPDGATEPPPLTRARGRRRGGILVRRAPPIDGRSRRPGRCGRNPSPRSGRPPARPPVPQAPPQPRGPSAGTRSARSCCCRLACPRRSPPHPPAVCEQMRAPILPAAAGMSASHQVAVDAGGESNPVGPHGRSTRIGEDSVRLSRSSSASRARPISAAAPARDQPTTISGLDAEASSATCYIPVPGPHVGLGCRRRAAQMLSNEVAGGAVRIAGPPDAPDDLPNGPLPLKLWN